MKKYNFNSQDFQCQNKTHILIVNHDQLKYTQSVISDILKQEASFDLTIFDNNSSEEGTKKYYDYIKEIWFRNDCALNIIQNNDNTPLNRIWNWFFEMTVNEYMVLLNNDVRIEDNFIKHGEEIFEKEKECGIVSHPTNRETFVKQNKLTYETQTNPTLQGWDIFIRREAFTPIPDSLLWWCGDNFLFQEMCKKGYTQIYNTSSPLIHYHSVTIDKERNKIKNILTNDKITFEKLFFKKEIQILTNDNKYIKRLYQGKGLEYVEDKVIVSLTTYPKRINNLPFILDNILKQTIKPYKIVVNLSTEEYPKKKESIPTSVMDFISKHKNVIEINFIEGKNNKVWKKFIPTMCKYKAYPILCIDDDFIYPNGMIKDFLETYNKDIYNPVSGNREYVNGLPAHCGCCSLIKYEFFRGYIENLNNDFYMECPSSDIYYTFVINKKGLYYNHTKELYFNNMKKYNEGIGYSRQEEISKKREKIISFIEDYLSKKEM